MTAASSPGPGNLEELYQSVILDHNRRPRNYREMPDATVRRHGENPSCGDNVTVFLRIDGDVIADVTWQALGGCAISRASASIMTTVVKGKTRAEVEQLFQYFHDLVTRQPASRPGYSGESDRGDPVRSLDAFSGVSRFPGRVKCATLSWHALRSALGQSAA